MTQDEYIQLHTRLRKRYKNRYPYNSLETLNWHTELRHNTLATTPQQAVYDYIIDQLGKHKTLEVNLLLIDQAITTCASHYATHNQPGRGLAHIETLEHTTNIATPDTIRQIRQTIRP
jgi:hypothetical protein